MEKSSLSLASALTRPATSRPHPRRESAPGEPSPGAGIPRPRAVRRTRRLRLTLLAGLILLALAVELRTSWVQSLVLAGVARLAAWTPRFGAGEEPLPAPRGPYDVRLGYAELPSLVGRLRDAGFQVVRQARWTGANRGLAAFGIPPLYREKSQAGLRLLDRSGQELYAFRYPTQIYRDFGDIPPLVATTAAFLENRELLRAGSPYRNPAIEWDRMAKAALDYSLHLVRPSHSVSGGSTMATQLEKLRHSPSGRTTGVVDKGRQVAAASLRAYAAGRVTSDWQRQIVCDYLNSIPLAAVSGYGEVTGLAEGLAYWFGADFDDVNRLLWMDESEAERRELTEARARAYRMVLTLLAAANRPTELLRENRSRLEKRVHSFLPLLEQEGILSPRFRRAVERARIEPQARAKPPADDWEPARKGINAVRLLLMQLFGKDRLYDLDRMDALVNTTLDGPALRRVSRLLLDVSDPQTAATMGLTGFRLLAPESVAGVYYTFTLYERSGGVNRLVLQADNSAAPLDLNSGSKLEFGSTAKLRTLATYLELVAQLHAQLERKGAAGLERFDDPLTRWALEYHASQPDRSTTAMLDAAMNRRYSASPAEGFFTGGGLHYFSNFDDDDNHRVMTVREAFQRSVNLVFIRLLRDIVQYYTVRLPGYDPAMFRDSSHPARRPYLERFADREGAVFLRTYYERYAGLSPDEALEKLLENRARTPERLAALFLSARPTAGFEDFRRIAEIVFGSTVSTARLESLYRQHRSGEFDWNDKGYLAGVHPLELWLVAYLSGRPGATWQEVKEASQTVRTEVYRWLFRDGLKAAQDLRIRTVLELDAFEQLHRSWRRQGFPFRVLTPSLATAIGSSGDTPAALAELVGIIQNGGLRLPRVMVDRILLGPETPYETELRLAPDKPERVFPPEVAAQLRKEMIGVVEAGTARRAFGAVPGPGGRPLEIGGKTGTGDNRDKAARAAGGWRPGRVRNRTAAFVFLVGDRYFGAVTAYVPGEYAIFQKFTSSLPVQLFTVVAPELFRLLDPVPAPEAAGPLAAIARNHSSQVLSNY